jgi:hypothetical protein
MCIEKKKVDEQKNLIRKIAVSPNIYVVAYNGVMVLYRSATKRAVPHLAIFRYRAAGLRKKG